jgi:hypothetical protein
MLVLFGFDFLIISQSARIISVFSNAFTKSLLIPSFYEVFVKRH